MIKSLNQLDDKINKNKFDEANKLAYEIYEEKGPSIELLSRMIKINEHLKNYNKVLIYSNLILMIDPLNINVINNKINSLKNLRKLDILSDFLVELQVLEIDINMKKPTYI